MEVKENSMATVAPPCITSHSDRTVMLYLSQHAVFPVIFVSLFAVSYTSYLEHLQSIFASPTDFTGTTSKTARRSTGLNSKLQYSPTTIATAPNLHVKTAQIILRLSLH